MLYLATYKGLNLIILAFALKQPTPAPVYAPKIPTEPEIDPEELEKIFSGALPVAVPQQMVKPYSLQDFFKRKAPPGQSEIDAPSDTEASRNPQTREERELLLKADIEKFRQYAKDKRFENLDDEDLTNYFAINIAENFRFDLGLLSNFVKSEKYLKLSSQDPAAEKYYMRATALLKNYFEDTWGRVIPGTSSPQPATTPAPSALAPEIKAPPSGAPQKPEPISKTEIPSLAPIKIPDSPSKQNNLPPLGEPVFANPHEQAFHERTRALRASQGNRSLKDLSTEEKRTLLARLTAEHYAFNIQKIKDTLREITETVQKNNKAISAEETAYAQEAIHLIETEIQGPNPEAKTTTAQSTTKDLPIGSSATASPLIQLLRELTQDFARDKYNAGQFYAAEEALKRANSSLDPMGTLEDAAKNPLLRKIFAPEILADLGKKLAAPKNTATPSEQKIPAPAPLPPQTAKEPEKSSAPPSPVADETAPAQKTDRSAEEYLIWTVCEKQLTARFRELFATMNEAQKMHVVAAARDRIQREAQKQNTSLSALDISRIIMPIISHPDELLTIINNAERAYTSALKNFEAINEALANWAKAHPKEKITEDAVSSIIFALPPLKAFTSPLKMERVPLTQKTDEKEARPELMLSNKENLLRMICGISASDYMAIQKIKLKDLYAKRKPERLIKLCDGYGLRDKEAGYLTLRQFINKEIAFL